VRHRPPQPRPVLQTAYGTPLYPSEINWLVQRCLKVVNLLLAVVHYQAQYLLHNLSLLLSGLLCMTISRQEADITVWLTHPPDSSPTVQAFQAGAMISATSASATASSPSDSLWYPIIPQRDRLAGPTVPQSGQFVARCGAFAQPTSSAVPCHPNPRGSAPGSRCR